MVISRLPPILLTQTVLEVISPLLLTQEYAYLQAASDLPGIVRVPPVQKMEMAMESAGFICCFSSFGQMVSPFNMLSPTE